MGGQQYGAGISVSFDEMLTNAECGFGIGVDAQIESRILNLRRVVKHVAAE